MCEMSTVSAELGELNSLGLYIQNPDASQAWPETESVRESIRQGVC